MVRGVAHRGADDLVDLHPEELELAGRVLAIAALGPSDRAPLFVAALLDAAPGPLPLPAPRRRIVRGVQRGAVERHARIAAQVLLLARPRNHPEPQLPGGEG